MSEPILTKPWQQEYKKILDELLESFDKFLFSVVETEENRIFIFLLNKINSNCRAALNLIYQGFVLEGYMILRSAVESAVYLQYLILHPREKEKYFRASYFSNLHINIIRLKGMAKNGTVNKNSALRKFLDPRLVEIAKENPDKFPHLTVNIPENISLKDIDELGKFLFKEGIPPPQKFSTHSKDPETINKLGNLRECLIEIYSEKSSIIHGNFKHWLEQPKLDGYTLKKITHQVKSIFISSINAMNSMISASTTLQYCQKMLSLQSKEQKISIPKEDWLENDYV